MKVLNVLLALLLLAAAGAYAAADAGLIPPQTDPTIAGYIDMGRTWAPKVIAGLSLLLFLTILFWRRPKPAPAPVVAPTPAIVPPAPAPAPAAKSADAEVVNFLALMQEKGRLVDFLMDDIARYSDAEVGAAGRVLHEGCKAVLKEHFGLRPVREEAEGARVTVLPGYAPDEYRLVGRIGGEAPFTGKLVHHGWKTEWVKLPRLIRSDKPPAIAPAEVELG